MDPNWRALVVGSEKTVPVHGGGTRRYTNLDNAASTPPLVSVRDSVFEFLEWYASVHRGNGFKSRLSTWLYETTRDVTAEFFGADLAHQVVIYGKNATEALNKLAYRLPLDPGDVVLSTEMEHHSNLLPWRRDREVDHVAILDDGSLDLDDLVAKLDSYGRRVKLFTCSGASNVTGELNPLGRIARLCHERGVLFGVDAAQLAPHRPVKMGAKDDPERIDFLSCSAHKLYAPFGTGVLIGPWDFFSRGTPELVGGGTVAHVTLNDVEWNAPPDREEAGSPNVVGAVAMAAAMKALQRIGWDAMVAHEKALTARLLTGLGGIDKVDLYGRTDPASVEQRTGVVAWNIEGMPHALTASTLAWEWAIAVRDGTFCARPLASRLFRGSTGAVRISFGIQNTTEDVDLALAAIESLAKNGPAARYRHDRTTGDWVAEDGISDFAPYFSL